VGDGVGGEPPELVRVRAGADQLEPLGHADVPGVGLVQPLAEGRGVLDEPLGVVESPPEQGQAGPSRLGGVAVAWLAAPVEQGEAGLQRGLEGR
jgi:hypothetical protein